MGGAGGRYIGGGERLGLEESWGRLLRAIGHWSLGFGQWIVEDGVTGALLGEAGLFDFRRAMAPPPRERSAECGWVFAARAHGRGLATEAVRAMLAWSEARQMGEVWCMIDPANAASLRVAEKTGFTACHDAIRKGSAVRVLIRNGARL